MQELEEEEATWFDSFNKSRSSSEPNRSPSIESRSSFHSANRELFFDNLVLTLQHFAPTPSLALTLAFAFVVAVA
jgi:hypothetical protein